MARHAYQHPIAGVPQLQAEAVDKVAWPELARAMR